MKKEFIQNRKGQNMAIIVENVNNPKGLAIVMHGLGGFKEQSHIQAIADAGRENGYTAIRFDTTNTLGESDGNYEDATTTNYYEDLEDVIAWAKTQEWYQEPFVLAGHSLGGISVALFAEKFPAMVKALAPLSTVVSGKLSVEAHKQYDPEGFKRWEKTGWREEESRSKPGAMKRLRWSHIDDRLKYDLLPNVGKLAMPVLLIVGGDDQITPLAHQKILYNALPGPKELYVIKGAPHTFRDPDHVAEIEETFSRWLAKLSELS